MYAVVRKDKNGHWSVTPKEGNFAGQHVMTVDGITLERVTFDEDGLTGNVKAVWGAVIPDHLDLDRFTLKGLGVGGVFMARANSPMQCVDGRFYDGVTKQPLIRASQVMLVWTGAFYSNRANR